MIFNAVNHCKLTSTLKPTLEVSTLGLNQTEMETDRKDIKSGNQGLWVERVRTARQGEG